MRHHTEGCESLGVTDCPGCEDDAKAHGQVKRLRRALRSALRQIDVLAVEVEGEAALYDQGEESGKSIAGARLWKRARTARNVARRIRKENAS